MIPSGYWQAAKSKGKFNLVYFYFLLDLILRILKIFRNTNLTFKFHKTKNDLTLEILL